MLIIVALVFGKILEPFTQLLFIFEPSVWEEFGSEVCTQTNKYVSYELTQLQ